MVHRKSGRRYHSYDERLFARRAEESPGRGTNQFYTRAARSASATYRVLFYRLPGRRRSCKVDILTPGTNELNIPFIRPGRIVRINELPVLPFLVLLLLKAQGWLHHTMSSRRDFNEKVDVDVRDVNELLGIGRRRGEDINEQTWIPAWFLDHGLSVMQDYVDVNGGHHRWELLGFAPA